MTFPKNRKKEDSLQVGTDYEHQRVEDYLNTTTKELKQLLNNNENDYLQTFLQGLTPTESAD
jgi:hypothetical protein